MHPEQTESANDPIIEFFERMRGESADFKGAILNDNGNSEALWNRIVEGFIDAFVEGAKCGHHPSIEYLCDLTIHALCEGKADSGSKEALSKRLERSAFYRMIERLTGPTRGEVNNLRLALEAMRSRDMFLQQIKHVSEN